MADRSWPGPAAPSRALVVLGAVVPAAVVTAPLLFNPQSEQVFEPEKAAALRLLLVLVLSAGVMAWTAGGRPPTARAREGWRGALRAAALATLASVILSTALGVAPGLSVAGGYVRRQGLVSELAYLAVFLATVWALPGRAGARRVLHAMALAGLAAAVYGLAQSAGLDPVAWGRPTDRRILGAAGNPIFLGATLAMTVPLTVGLALDARAAARRETGPPWAPWLFLALAGTQAWALLLTRSRGPLLGLGAGLALLGLVGLGRAPRGRAQATLAAGLVAAAVLGSVVTPSGPLAPLARTPVARAVGLDRVADGLAGQTASVTVRLRLWEGMLDAAVASPGRTLVGYGPETQVLVHPPHARPLAGVERADAAGDRAHNRTLDLWVTRGLVGVAVDLVLVGLLLAFALVRCRLADTAAARAVLAGGTALGAGLGAGVPWALDAPALSGPGLGAGAAAGLLVAVAGLQGARALAGSSPEGPTSPTGGRALPALPWLAAGVAAAVLAHFVESQVGIQTGTTRLFLWVLAGVVWTLAAPGGATRRAHQVAAGLGSPPHVAEAGLGHHGAPGLTWGLVVGLCAATATFGVVVSTSRVAPLGPLLAILAAAVLGTGVALAAPGTRRRVAGLASASFVAALVLQWAWIGWAGVDAVDGSQALDTTLARVGRLSWTLPLHGAFLVSLVLCAGSLTGPAEGSAGGPRPGGGRRRAALGGLCTAMAVVAGLALLTPSRADVFAHLGRRHEQQGLARQAAALYGQASRLQPREPAFRALQARATMDGAVRMVGDPGGRAAATAESLALGRLALALRPQDPRYHLAVAALETEAGLGERDPAARNRHFQRADSAYAGAVQAGPSVPGSWTSWGESLLRRNAPDRALDPLERSRELDPGYALTHRLLGDATLRLGRFDRARGAYRAAVDLRPGDGVAWRGLGSALGQTDDPAGAVEAYGRAVELGAGDVLVHRNLALLLGGQGRLAEAVAHARRALELAPPSMADDVERLLRQLEEMADGPGAPEPGGDAGP